jgi:predicted alpha/beta-fold hydrolase
MDLRAAVDALDRGFNKWTYTANFLRTMKRKSLAKIAAHNLPIDITAVRACATLRAIDELCTAPIHGFASAEDYYCRSSSKPFLPLVRVPTLLLNARNDPFIPAAVLPSRDEVSKNLALEFPQAGGHVGFVSGNFPGRLDWLPQRIIEFFSGQS